MLNIAVWTLSLTKLDF